MEWEFTPEQVVKAEVDYGLEHFRRDMAEEIRMNLSGADAAQQAQSFSLIYDMCYALATNRELDDFLAGYAYDPPTCEFLREVQPLMNDNIQMLGAILQHMIMDGVERGLPLDNAVEEAASRHAEIVSMTI